MSGYQLRGVLGTPFHLPAIDVGTLSRGRSAAPGLIGSGLRRLTPSPARIPTLRILRLGMHGDDVAWLQKLLNPRLQPSPSLATDGDFGPTTEHAVCRFQGRAGLLADGVVGPASWLCLQASVRQLNDVEHHAVPTRKPAPVPPPGLKAAGTQAPRPPAPQAGELPYPWMDVARIECGVKEVAGAQHNPRILAYHATTSLRAQSDEIAWCSSFVNWVMREAGYKGTNSAAAASWISWGADCQPREGAIMVIRNARAANSSLTSSGNHVGFLVEATDTHYVILGGNQSDQVKESRFRKSSWTLRASRWPGP